MKGADALDKAAGELQNEAAAAAGMATGMIALLILMPLCIVSIVVAVSVYCCCIRPRATRPLMKGVQMGSSDPKPGSAVSVRGP